MYKCYVDSSVAALMVGGPEGSALCGYVTYIKFCMYATCTLHPPDEAKLGRNHENGCLEFELVSVEYLGQKKLHSDI